MTNNDSSTFSVGDINYKRGLQLVLRKANGIGYFNIFSVSSVSYMRVSTRPQRWAQLHWNGMLKFANGIKEH